VIGDIRRSGESKEDVKPGVGAGVRTINRLVPHEVHQVVAGIGRVKEWNWIERVGKFAAVIGRPKCVVPGIVFFLRNFAVRLTDIYTDFIAEYAGVMLYVVEAVRILHVWIAIARCVS